MYCILNLLFDKDNLDNEIIDELLIFRRNLEIAILKLAVKKVVPMDIRNLRSHLKTFEEGISTGKPSTVAYGDEIIHKKIAEISKSRILSKIASSLWKNLSYCQKFYFEKTENSEVKFRGLKKVIDAMEIGNTNTAVKTMETILEYGDQEFIARVYYSKSEGGDSMANY